MAAVMAMMTAVVVPAAVGAEPPDTVVTSPAANATLDTSAVTLAGTATDDIGVDSVLVAVRDRAAQLWMQDDGSFAAGFNTLESTLDRPGATSTGWTLDVDLPDGSYAVNPRAVDGDGTVDPTRPWVPFTVLASGREPNTVVTSPEVDATLDTNPVTLAGTADDDSSVVAVRVAVRDVGNQLWRQPDGSFGTAFALTDAVLDAPGAATTGWSLDVDLPDGSYAVDTRAVDGGGIIESTRPWVRFTVLASGREPNTEVTAPTAGQTLATSPVTLAGTADDDTAIAEVRVAVRDTANQLWRQPDGSFGTDFAYTGAALDAPGAATTGWSLDVDLPDGSYAVDTRAVDGQGIVETTRPWVRFSVELDVTPPPPPPPPPTGGGWPMFGHDVANSLVSGETTIDATNVDGLGLRWSSNTGAQSFTSPAVVFNEALDTEVIYVGDQANNVSAFDAQTGERIWVISVGDDVSSSPAVVDGVLYFGSSDDQLHARNATTGAPICTFDTGGNVTSSPLVVDPDGDGPLGKIVYFGDNGLTGADDGGNMWAVHAVDPDAAADCSLLWSFDQFGDPPGSIDSAGVWSIPAIGWAPDGSPIVVVGSSSPEGAVYAFDALTGAVLWRYQTIQFFQDDDVGAGVTISAPGVNGFANGVAYVPGKNRIVHAFDLVDGTLLWEFRIRDDAAGVPGATRSTMALVGDRLFVGFGHGMYALDAVTGAKIWRSDEVGPQTQEIVASPAVTGAPGQEVLLVGDLAGFFYGFSAATGEQLWSHGTGAFIYGSFAITGGSAYAPSADGFLYAFDLDPGTDPRPETTIATPADGATVANPDGNLVLSGTATDDSGVQKVRVAVKDLNRNQWWDEANQRWITPFTQWEATLDAAGQPTTGWTASFPPGFDGSRFSVQAESLDDAGQRDPDPALAEFFVPSLGNPPETTIDSPVFREIFNFPGGVRQEFPITIRGTATDSGGANPGIERVRVYIRNIEHQEYYCGFVGCGPGDDDVHGADWVPSFTFLDAELDDPGATTTTWSITFPTYDHPHKYRIEAMAVDLDGENDATRAVVSRICVRDVGDTTCA